MIFQEEVVVPAGPPQEHNSHNLWSPRYVQLTPKRVAISNGMGWWVRITSAIHGKLN